MQPPVRTLSPWKWKRRGLYSVGFTCLNPVSALQERNKSTPPYDLITHQSPNRSAKPLIHVSLPSFHNFNSLEIGLKQVRFLVLDFTMLDWLVIQLGIEGVQVTNIHQNITFCTTTYTYIALPYKHVGCVH